MKLVTCLACVEAASPAGPAAGLDRADDEDVVRERTLEVVEHDIEPLASPIDLGTPGMSAHKEFERRRAKREQKIEDKWGGGRLGRLVKAISDDPQSTRAWAQGAKGEERVAEILHDRVGDRAVLLHDRKVPGTRGNIDHLAIAASGVWIIDAKRYTGKVERRNVGGFFRSDIRLYVGGRDRTKTVAGLAWQVEAVRRVLDDDALPVHPSLSFVGAEWPILFAKPFQLDGVWISWPGKLADLMLDDGPLMPADIERVARLLAGRLSAN